MKRILITGANSYIGTNVEKWLLKEPKRYIIDTLDMEKSSWKAFDFSNYDIVFHVAGIAHVSKRKSFEELYFRVNRDLTFETAKIAKESGVKHFIFMSSMIVYNSKEEEITAQTVPNPDNLYGLSKLSAEKKLNSLECQTFRLTILRPPMIYGLNSKGNFSRLIKLTEKIFVFPKYYNRRSMLYIDNLSNIIKHVIDNEIFGLLFPQNSHYVCTYEIIEHFSKVMKNKIYFTKLFNLFIYILKNKISIVNKMFSNYYYDINLSNVTNQYCIIGFDDSLKYIIERTNHNE